MRPDSRSVSFVFQKDTLKENKPETVMTRRSLKGHFEREQVNSTSSLPSVPSNRSALTVVANTLRSNFSLSSLSSSSVKTGKVLKSGALAGAEKISRTFNNVCTSLDSLSQRLRRSTRRRYRLANGSPVTPGTPGTRTRRVLGRTPTKLYSPFAIETPRQKTVASGYISRKNRNFSVGGSNELGSLHSPHQKFASDIASARDGVADFNRTATSIVRRSLRQ